MIGKSPDGGANKVMTADDLASFIISLCWLAGETSANNVANGRCVPFDRASIDVGILWDHSDAGDDSLPPFHYLDTESDDSLIEYAEKLISRVNGDDTAEWSKRNKNKRDNKAWRQKQADPDDYGEYTDDDYHYPDADALEGDEGSEEESKDGEEAQDRNAQNSTFEEMIKSRLDKLHLSGIRSLFKEQANMLLKINPPPVKDEEAEETDEGTEEANEASAEEDASDQNEEKEDENNNIDPVAINMAKSTINKRLAGINRGEAAAKFAARHIIALMKIRHGNNRSVLDDMQSLAMMTAHHSQISIDDIAELIYTTSSAFRPDIEIDPSTCPVTSPWSVMCPPQTVSLQGSTSTFPPKFIVNAANRLCEQRTDALTGVCTAQGELDLQDFPTTIPDGYYNYYTPKARDPPDGAGTPFSTITALFQMPSSLSSLIKGMKKIEESHNSIRKEVDTLERDVGGTGDLKFGMDGELFFLRDTCHKVESGKYEYEVCIFGKATQRDIGQKSGGTNLGNWHSFQIENGVRTLKWSDGTKCWNGPKRSAEVTVTCGGLETRLLTADEPETCRYVFTMESPIGCDDQFKLNNSL
jgi:protein kinase C substrate 80K-H